MSVGEYGLMDVAIKIFFAVVTLGTGVFGLVSGFVFITGLIGKFHPVVVLVGISGFLVGGLSLFVFHLIVADFCIGRK